MYIIQCSQNCFIYFKVLSVLVRDFIHIRQSMTYNSFRVNDARRNTENGKQQIFNKRLINTEVACLLAQIVVIKKRNVIVIQNTNLTQNKFQPNGFKCIQ